MGFQSELALARELNRILRQSGLTVAVAEGATGGRIGERLARYSGATSYFKGGVVTYDYPSRIRILGIPSQFLRERGAVSKDAVAAMAQSVRTLYGSDIGLASSGIAGPRGTAPGLLFLSLSNVNQTITRQYHLSPRSRHSMQSEFTRLGLLMLRDHVDRILH